jgi:ATP-dependent DNA helicase RecQ
MAKSKKAKESKMPGARGAFPQYRRQQDQEGQGANAMVTFVTDVTLLTVFLGEPAALGPTRAAPMRTVRSLPYGAGGCKRAREQSVEVEPGELRRVLRERFGYEAFRPGQERIVRDLLAGRDVLAVLPMGAGKSLVYQLAAQLLPGVTLVVTPLLALMKDQLDSLAEHGLAAESISSAQTDRESDAALRDVQGAGAKLLYVTPERFEDDEFMAEARRLDVSLLVVDEAHCISEWGHSFRPAYLAVGQAAARLGRPTLLALTATATPWVRRDVIERLGLRDPDVVVRGVDRPNLFLQAVRVEAESEDRRVLERLLRDDGDDSEQGRALAAAMQGSGIVYTATTRAAQETAGWLQEWGIAADYFHGQRRKADRVRVQEAFMAGELRVIAATNAFGLGVDKPDIRFVIHRDVPPNLEAYYQEAGRAGRDGELARCTLIYRPGDLGRAAFLGGSGQLTREEVVRAHAGLVARREGTTRELMAATGLGRGDFARLVSILERAGLVAQRRGHIQLLVADFDPHALPLETEEQRLAYEHSRLEMMRGYAECRECRRRYLLGYFGEQYEGERCGQCDNDTLTADGERPLAVAAQAEGPFAVHERVAHAAWGEGVVYRVVSDAITVLFDRVGYKTLRSDLVQEQGLLQRAG